MGAVNTASTNELGSADTTVLLDAHTLVMERGKVAEQGRFADLKNSGGALQKLLAA